MRPASSPYRQDFDRVSVRRRAVALGLTILAHLLLLLMLLKLAPPFTPPAKGNPGLIGITLQPEAQRETAHSKDHHPHAERTRAARAAAQHAPPPQVEHFKGPLPLIPLSHDELAAADIGRMPSRKPGPPLPDAVDASAESGGSQGGAGGIATLYNAQWYREPTDAELSYYLPPGVPPDSWAEIACQTVPRYHVDNCRELGGSQPGLAGAIRQAAWQFLVWPPRVNGRPLVGSWVRIRIDFTRVKGR